MGADTHYVRGWLRRIASVALAAFAFASLSGCGGGPGGPSSGGWQQVEYVAGINQLEVQ